MKSILFALALTGCVLTVKAQEADTLSSPSKGDYFEGLTRPLTFNRMIPPYALEVTFSKTVHIIFPAAIRYVDLGSADSRVSLDYSGRLKNIFQTACFQTRTANTTK